MLYCSVISSWSNFYSFTCDTMPTLSFNYRFLKPIIEEKETSVRVKFANIAELTCMLPTPIKNSRWTSGSHCYCSCCHFTLDKHCYYLCYHFTLESDIWFVSLDCLFWSFILLLIKQVSIVVYYFFPKVRLLL